jgi:flagellar biosynthesis protein
VPLYENAELAGILARLDLNEEIPETLYRVIAEILAFAFNLEGRTPGDAGTPPVRD